MTCMWCIKLINLSIFIEVNWKGIQQLDARLDVMELSRSNGKSPSDCNIW